MKNDFKLDYDWKELKNIYEERALKISKSTQSKQSRLSRKHEVIIKVIDKYFMILDAGCGTGPYTAHLAKRQNNKVYAIDISFEIIKQTKIRIKNENNQDESNMVNANLEKLPFKNEAFEGIVCSQVIEHLLKDMDGFDELQRVLKKDGLMVFSTDNKRNYISRILAIPVNIYKKIIKYKGEEWEYYHGEYNIEDLSEILKQKGFSIKEEFTFRVANPISSKNVKIADILTEIVEKILIKLPIIKNYGDIVVFVCKKN